MTVNTILDVRVIDDPDECKKSPIGKPFLRVICQDGTTVDMTTNVAEMLGGIGAGVRKRYEGAGDASKH